MLQLLVLGSEGCMAGKGRKPRSRAGRAESGRCRGKCRPRKAQLAHGVGQWGLRGGQQASMRKGHHVVTLGFTLALCSRHLRNGRGWLLLPHCPCSLCRPLLRLLLPSQLQQFKRGTQQALGAK